MSLRLLIGGCALGLCGCLGLPPWISLSESPLAFGRWPVGSSSPPKIVTVTNIGDGQTGELSCKLLLADPSFEVNCDACTGRKLDPGESCELSVTFNPREDFYLASALQVDAEPGRRKIVELSGVGVVAYPYLSEVAAEAATPSGEVAADGLERFAVSVTAYDKTMSPVPNVKVTITSSGPGALIEQPAELTDADGVARGSVASTASGFTTIGATFPEGELLSRAFVRFLPPPADATLSSISLTSSGPVPADGVAKFTVNVTLRDRLGRPLQGRDVLLAATGEGTLLTQPASTGFDGVAMGSIASTVAGSKALTASADGVLVAEQAVATFVAGPPDGASSSLTVSPPGTIPADGVSEAAIEIVLADRDGNRVAGAQPVVTVSGTGNTLTPPAVTDAAGAAQATLVSTATGTKRVTVSVGGIPLRSVDVVFGP